MCRCLPNLYAIGMIRGVLCFWRGCGLLYGILGIFLQETEKFLFDMRKIYGTVLMLSAAVGINPVAVMSQGDSRHYAAMSEETLDSIYSRYGIPGTGLLRENYPFDSGYKAGYLAGDDGVQGNPYSYLWYLLRHIVGCVGNL